MTVQIEGNTAEQVAGRDIYNINNANEQELDERLLVPAQRKALNNLISDIAGYGELSACDIWLKLHALLGVNSINDIVIPQYEKAESFLQQELNKVIKKDTCKRLIHYILKEITNKNELKNKMNRYCQEQFGTSDLKTISKVQLQNVLSYVRNEAELQSIQRKDFLNHTISLIKLNPIPALIIFIVGFVLGEIFF